MVRIISRFGPKEQQFTSLHELEESSKSQAAQLYRAIVSTEEAGERAVLKNLPKAFNSKRYPIIRSELIEDLYRLVFVLDLKRQNYSEYAQRLNELRKSVFLATTLRAMGASLVAVNIAEKFIEEARELEEWLPALQLLDILRHDASLTGNAKEFEAYSAEYMRTLELHRAVQMADMAEDRIIAAFARSGSEKPWLKQETDAALKELAPAIEEYGTFKLQWSALQLRRYGLQLAMDYRAALAVADASDALLTQYPQFENKSKRFLNAKASATCYLQTRRYSEAQLTIERCEALEAAGAGAGNWFYLKEWKFLYLMRTEQFEAARALCQRVMKRKEFTSQSEPLQQKYRLFELWADFFTGHPLPMEAKSKGEKTGAISQGLLRLIPSLKEDQVGFKFSVIVLELLILLDRRTNRADLDNRIESLRVYKSRYLDGTAAEQAGLFIQLLDILGEHDYKAKGSREEGQPVLEQLVASMDEHGIHGEEIMPYDWTWLKLLEAAGGES